MANKKKCFNKTDDSNILNERPDITSGNIFTKSTFPLCHALNEWMRATWFGGKEYWMSLINKQRMRDFL